MRILVDEFPFSPEDCIFMKRANGGRYICSIGKRLYKCEAECDLFDRVLKHQCLGLKLIESELKELEE